MNGVDLPDLADQDLLRSSSARFARTVCPLVTVRKLGDSKTPVDRDYIAAAGELGWFAMLVTEAHGGGCVSGRAMADAALIAGERGRTLQPGPFVPMNVVADALSQAGSAAQRADVLPALAAGDTTAAWAVADGRGRWDPGRSVRCTSRGQRYALDGVAALVQDAASVDWLLVTAGSDDGLAQFLVRSDAPGIAVERQNALDVTRQFYRVSFDGVAVSADDLVGVLGGVTALVQRQFQVASVLTVAEMVGAMETDFAMTVDYAKARIAFGRPIGSFQAVKHLLADTSLLLESSKAARDAAVRSVDDALDAGQAASVAKAYLGEAAVDLAQNCFQVLGGIGFTWEHDHHLFMRRLATDAMLYGDPAWHRANLCSLAGFGGGPP